MKSIEEKIENIAKRQLEFSELKYFIKTEDINSELANAMVQAPSKTGGDGKNYPDIKLLLETKDKKLFPVMIEVKGISGKLEKINDFGEIENIKKDGSPNFANINGFAVNGAVHYAKAIIDFTDSYKEVIAIGFNGYEDKTGDIKTELGIYYVSAKNMGIPKKVGNYSDLSFLAKNNFENFIAEVQKLELTQQEVEQRSQKIENEIEVNLKALNQKMQDDLQISVGSRVELLTGMLMAGLGVENKVAPLEITDLRGETGRENNDGKVILNKISDFLDKRDLPTEKKEMIITDLSRVFISSGLSTPINGESKLKTIYSFVEKNILPIFTSAYHLDFTGKLFNVLNAWVNIPDSDKNDVVLTPRYVTILMAKLAKVDMDSYVWDYATGSAGFLVSSMKLMIDDATKNIKSPERLNQKIVEIKNKQLLGIEKRSDIYLLAVLNMILMGDGSTNIIHDDSLKNFEGKYQQGENKNKDFPANVFLLNPPYSADGKGFVFVKKGLSKMNNGRAVILIQENAGSGNGLPYTKEILEKNTLLASIRMADIFRGKAGVQTAIYVFEVGKKHDEKQKVKFIDFSNDGYSRQNRKKSGQDVNLKNTNNATERYQEVIDLVLYGKDYLKYLTKDEYIEDVITLNGNDWTFSQHKIVDTRPTEEDFKKVVSDYLAWEVSRVLKGE